MRTALSRILLVGFLVLAIVAVIVGTSGNGGGDVSFDALDADHLAHRPFVLEGTGRFAIDAVGSFEEVGTPASDTTLAAYGWIVRREDGAVVWTMDAERPERGTLATVRDTVVLEAGTYDLYFTSYGDPLVRDPGPRNGSLGERIRATLSRGGRSWVGDAGRWRMNMHGLNEAARNVRTSGIDRDPALASIIPSPTFVWQGRGVEDRQDRVSVLHVVEPATVRIRTVTEITDGVVADRASIVRLGSQEVVWEASGEGAWAGGSLKNRILDDTLSLEPGLYRVSFEADRSHAYDDWTANPPWVPSSWGIRVERASPEEAVAVLDPSALDLPQLVSFECVGPDEERRAEFVVPSATDLLVVAVGELAYGSEYDYAMLERRDEDGDWDDVWEMSDMGAVPAGGASKNRRVTVPLSLEPGDYRLTYETDGSHDCVSGYNEGGGPTEPLWGAILFVLDESLDVASFDVRVIEPEPEPDLDLEDDVVGIDLMDAERLLARIDSVGDDEDRRVRFVLDRPQRVEIRAAGELSESSQYDWAAIYREGGELVWEMTSDNTSPGESSSSYHRVYRGGIVLEAGTYTVRYRTDGSRSFGDFGESSRRLWGVHVYGPPNVPAMPPVEDAAPPPPPAPPGPVPTNSI
ncbi:hypothetical protein [Rubrivirga sp.]|uniref:hypothetical protein n=1 Tax=Rubrivirga sp. TaxID=1885344 RepID=UPI003C71496B